MTLVLGIETSCGETAIALLERRGDGWEIRSEAISSQTVIHEEYGGVVPELASREHLRNLPLLLDRILGEGKTQLASIDAIAVTRGPGLKGCLLVGYGFAKALALARTVPLLTINHIEGHLLAPVLDNPALRFPYLALVVSGGHTEIVIAHELGRYEIVARTSDDAAGEAFDKSANLLGLPYPGGARLAALADTVSGTDLREVRLPRVMRDAPGFSFSGLKTAIALLIERKRREEGGALSSRTEALIAASVQEAIVDALIYKVKQAIAATGIRRLAITGGVSANRALRAAAGRLGVEVFLPRMDHCMDNAAMIAFAAALRFERGERASFTEPVLSRWPVEDLSVGTAR